MADLLAFFGHHKCATTWLCGVARFVCRVTGRRFGVVHDAEALDHSLAHHVATEPLDFLAYTNARQETVDTLGPLRGFHVVRDPRDIIVSAYFSHLHSHGTDVWTELADFRDRLRDADKEDGLFLEMDFREEELSDLAAWNYDQPGVLELKMETLIANPYDTVLRAFEHLGLVDASSYSMKRRLRYLAQQRFPQHFARPTVPAQELVGYVYRRRFSALTGGRTRGDEDVTHHYRKGVAGDWRNHFTAAHIAHFKAHYNHLLTKLGYERDADW